MKIRRQDADLTLGGQSGFHSLKRQSVNITLRKSAYLNIHGP